MTIILYELQFRANLHGWPNVYTFTKAMGERILLNMKGDVPLIIARPTMILSTLSEPFPGWIEGLRYVFQRIMRTILEK